MSETTYTIRPLTGDDIFPMCGIISRLGEDAISKCLDSPMVRMAMAGEEVDESTVGVAVMAKAAVVILGRLKECREELYAFLASLTGLAPEEIGSMPPAQLVRMVSEVVHREDFRDFFSAAWTLCFPALSGSLTSSSAGTPTP